ncbi:MAG: YncE family protein [Desulfococcaceae bacterium]
MSARSFRFASIAAILGFALVFGTVPAGAKTAVVATTAADFSSGAHATIAVEPENGQRAVQTDLAPTISDITVAAFGTSFYRIERFMADNVTKFEIDAPATPAWQYSTLDAGETVSGNPYGMVFVDENRALLLRFGKAAAWFVDPTPADEAGFKIGEVDLSPLADADGVPEMAGGATVGDRIFVILQRQDRDAGFIPGEAYVAVVDAAAGTLIDPGVTAAPGIPLPARNPQRIQYVPENDTIYIACNGPFVGFGPPELDYTGGIVTINPNTFETNLLVDDGDADNHPYGTISNLAVLSPEKGYFIGFNDFGDNNLYAFDPVTGAVTGPVAPSLQAKNLATLAAGPDGFLWVGNATDAQVALVDPATDTVVETVDTGLNPARIVFADDADSAPSPDEDGSGGGGSGCFLNALAR